MTLIIVKIITGKNIPVEIESRDTLRDLKQMIFEIEGIRPEHRPALMFGVTRLVKGVTLLDLISSIQANDQSRNESETTPPVIHLILRLRGGGNVIFHEPDRSDSDRDDGTEKRSSIGEKEVKIHIKTITTGREIDVEIACSDTVEKVKQKIFEKEGIDQDHQRFVFDGREVSDGVVIDQFVAEALEIEARHGRPWYYFDDFTRTAHVTLRLCIWRFNGGGEDTTSDGVQTLKNSTRAVENQGEGKPIEGWTMLHPHT